VDIAESLIARPGQSQEGRAAAELAPHFADLDERSAADLFVYARRLAAQVRFYDEAGGGFSSAGDWSAFFAGGLPERRDGRTEPHLALLAAFLKLYRLPRCALNGFTARHLEFYYRRVLGFAPRPARADRAHVLVELKKGAPKVELEPAHAFSAGKDTAGVELVYAPTRNTVVGHARVEQVHTVYVDPADGGTVSFAPGIAPPELAPAPIGFALAAPVLRMKEGSRTVTLELELEAAGGLSATDLQDRLEAYLTGEKRWLGPYGVQATLAGSTLTLKIELAASEGAVVDYDSAKHQHAFATRSPVLQLVFNDRVAHGYAALRPLAVTAASLKVAVAGVKSLQLEGDAGPLDPKRAFQPFGPQPVSGARFLVGCPEALSKPLTSLTLEFDWLGLPPSLPFVTLIRFGEPQAGLKVAFRDAAGWEPNAEVSHPLYEKRLTFSTAARPGPRLAPAMRAQAFTLGGSAWLRKKGEAERYKRPALFAGTTTPPQSREGFVTLKLAGDLGHAAWRARLLGGNAGSEPYTPTLSEVSLSYETVSGRAALGAADEDSFTGAPLEFFHVGGLGQRREHAWLRSQLDYVAEKRVPLLPAYEDEGELLIGLSGIGPKEGVSLLFKLAEGSADPDVERQPQVSWAVLCDNHWKALAGGDAVNDETRNRLASGLVEVSVPPQATTDNTFTPPGLLWLKAAVHENVRGVCRIEQLAANAVEVERRAGSLPAGRVWTPLPAGSIKRLKTPIAAVKNVSQPFASFGGTLDESPELLNTHAAERLRHRNRCISAWDYERTVLAAFPEVRKVKCVAHSGDGGWLMPGRVLLVVVPDLRLRQALDPLRPRADAGTLRAIEAHLRARAPMGIAVRARNPRYETIQASFRVRFRGTAQFDFYSRKLNEALVAHLAPWREDPGHAVSFGGAVHRSALLDFVEEQPYVDYVTEFRMRHVRGAPTDGADVAEARASAPDAILVSAGTHDIAPAPERVP
jgi:hypothetical protein